MIQLQSPTRYYWIVTSRDVFGLYCVHCYWGGRFNHRHGSKVHFLDSERSAGRLIKALIKRRVRRDYVVISGGPAAGIEGLTEGAGLKTMCPG